MSTDLDATRIVRSWLHTDEHDSADRVLDNVLVLLDATPQHRSRWPVRRFAQMNSYAKLAIAAAAVVAVVLVGINLLPRSSSEVGGAGPAPSPSASTPASSSGSPAPTGAAVWGSYISKAGTYRAAMNGTPMTFTLPSDGWRNTAIPGAIERGSFNADNHAVMSFIGGPAEVSTDPCAGVSTPVPQTLAGAATAYTTIPGTHATGPTDVTVGGRPAKLVVLTIDPDIQCAPNQYWLFGKYSMYPDTLESVIRTWIIDVDGQLYEIDSNQATSTPSLDQEIQQIVDSITFE